MPLVAVIGQYAVWQNTLRRLGYSEKEIIDFLPGAGYEAWWLMETLKSLAVPFHNNSLIGKPNFKKMLDRMREYGMEPVLQGFYGMVPNSMITKFPNADIRNAGKMDYISTSCILSPFGSLYLPRLQRYSMKSKRNYLENPRYYGGDPFMKEAIQKGINITEAAPNIYIRQ